MQAIPEADRLRLARLITRLQDNPDKVDAILAKERLPERRPPAHVVGFSGTGGSGKSTLISRVLPVLRNDGLTVTVLAIDPSSETSGGALLGDRIRMRDSYLDPGVFIRSLATRGAPQAMTVAMPAIIRAASMFCDIVLVETAGSGQADVSIYHLVQTFVVVLAPLGDAITLMKAGQTEHAHLVVVNQRKGLVGGDVFVEQARATLGRQSGGKGWKRKVFAVDANTNEGVEAFVRDGILAHRDFVLAHPTT